MHNTLVLLVVGLTRRLLGEETPHLSRLAATGLRTLDTVLPAVTCTVQSTLLTGLAPPATGRSPTDGISGTRRRYGFGASPTG